MARLEDLIDTVADAKLREALGDEVKALKTRTPFGLVYERHLPETIGLAVNGGVRAGDQVRLRTDPASKKLLRVQSRNGARATVSDESGKESKVAVADLLTVRRFGDPVFPTLTSVGAVERSADRPYHAVVNGENFHALQLLRHTCEGKVDCIFIDPPYNTGARDWKYNNDYVESTDSWRHSKWLSFMEKRLRLAKSLLKPEGVLICTVDEHELHHLGLLMERLFPNYLRYAVSIVINSRGSTGTRNFGVVEEQALFVVPDLGYDLVEPREAHIPHLAGRQSRLAEDLLARILAVQPDAAEGLDLDDDEAGLLDRLATDGDGSGEAAEDDELEPAQLGAEDGEDGAAYWRGAVRTGQGTSFRTQRRKQFYPLLVDEESNEIVEVGEPLLDTDSKGRLAPPSWEPVDGLVPVWPTDEEGRERVWCFEPGRMRSEIAKGNVKLGRFNPRRNTYAVNVRRVRRTKNRFREITVWWEQSYDAGSNGTNILKRLLGGSGAFPFPKSVYEVRDLLATVVGRNPDALIVDFFAGSGTTLHAACLLNAEDDGRRRTILVTNNEVDAELAEKLQEEGLYPGDPDYERHGIFEAVTMPRAKAVITGKQPSGRRVQGRHKWAGGRPFAEGFEENCEFFRLDYLDPDQIELGNSFAALHPLLWLRAGARSRRPKRLSTKQGFAVAADAGYAVLFEEKAMLDLVAALNDAPEVDHVFLRTDSEDAYAEMCEQLARGIVTERLYGDYLDDFRAGVPLGT